MFVPLRYSRQWRRELIVYDDSKLTTPSSRYTLLMSTILLAVSVVLTQTRHWSFFCLCFQSFAERAISSMFSLPCRVIVFSFSRPPQTWRWPSSPGVNGSPVACGLLQPTDKDVSPTACAWSRCSARLLLLAYS
jgi:hypothetical protein